MVFVARNAMDCFEPMQNTDTLPKVEAYAYALEECATNGETDKEKQIHGEVEERVATKWLCDKQGSNGHIYAR